MARAQNNGGFAFPQLSIESGQRDGHGDLIEPFTTSAGGMTLRDWFAGQALAGYLASFGGNLSDPAPENAARMALRYADALLAMRSKAEDR